MVLFFFNLYHHGCLVQETNTIKTYPTVLIYMYWQSGLRNTHFSNNKMNSTWCHNTHKRKKKSFAYYGNTNLTVTSKYFLFYIYKNISKRAVWVKVNGNQTCDAYFMVLRHERRKKCFLSRVACGSWPFHCELPSIVLLSDWKKKEFKFSQWIQ